MGVEGGGEAVHEIKDGIISVHAAILAAAAGSRSGHAVRHCGCSGSVAATGTAACRPRGRRAGLMCGQPMPGLPATRVPF